MIFFACLHLVGLALLLLYTDLDAAMLVALSVLCFIAEAAVLSLIRSKRSGVMPRADVHSIVNDALGGVLRNTVYPSLIVDMYGSLLWYNDAARHIIPDDENYIGYNIETLIEDLSLANIGEDRRRIQIAETVYRVDVFSLDEENELTLIMLAD